MMELVTGVVVAFVTVAAVLEPLVRRSRVVLAGSASFDADAGLLDIEESSSGKVQALLALREVEFDRATGKLTDEDYEQLKQRYARVALAEIDGESPGASAEEDGVDAAELAVQRVKARVGSGCASCGDRPEPDAIFCSTCGRPLGATDALARCWKCGADMPHGARFCADCGLAVG